MNNVIIIGAGGHTRSILELLDINSKSMIGYVSLSQVSDIDLPYLGNDEYVLKFYNPNDYKILLGVVYLDQVTMCLRRTLLDKYSLFQGCNSIVAKSAVISTHTKLGLGTVVFEQAFVNRSIIGQHCVVNSGVLIEHDCIIGDNVFIGSGCIIGGGVSVDSDSFIGSGCIIRDGVSITSNTVIGMGGLVVKDIHESGIYYGQPVCFRRK